MIYAITPCPAPRMNKADAWRKRPRVMRYWSFRDEIKLYGVKIPDAGARITFWLPIPDGLSKREKERRLFKPHQLKPDLDNLLKALLDAVFGDDCHIWSYSAEKRWAMSGAIEIVDTTEAQG